MKIKTIEGFWMEVDMLEIESDLNMIIKRGGISYGDKLSRFEYVAVKKLLPFFTNDKNFDMDYFSMQINILLNHLLHSQTDNVRPKLVFDFIVNVIAGIETIRVYQNQY